MTTAKTTLVNCRLESCDIYIGRECHGYKASKFSNPFVIGRDGNREQVIAKHKAMLLADKALLKAVLTELPGHTLGCWCVPAPCHGDTYLELIREAEEQYKKDMLEEAREAVEKLHIFPPE